MSTNILPPVFNPPYSGGLDNLADTPSIKFVRPSQSSRPPSTFMPGFAPGPPPPRPRGDSSTTELPSHVGLRDSATDHHSEHPRVASGHSFPQRSSPIPAPRLSSFGITLSRRLPDPAEEQNRDDAPPDDPSEHIIPGLVVQPQWRFLSSSRPLSARVVPSVLESDSRRSSEQAFEPPLWSNLFHRSLASSISDHLRVSEQSGRLLNNLFSHRVTPPLSSSSSSSLEKMANRSFDQHLGYFHDGPIVLDDFVRLFLLHSGYPKSLTAFDRHQMKDKKTPRGGTSPRVDSNSTGEKIEGKVEPEMNSQNVQRTSERESKNGESKNGESKNGTEMQDDMLNVPHEVLQKILESVRRQMKVCEGTSLRGTTPAPQTASMVEDRSRVRNLVSDHMRRLCKLMIELPTRASPSDGENSNSAVPKGPKPVVMEPGVTNDSNSSQSSRRLLYLNSPYVWWNDHKQFYCHKRMRGANKIDTPDHPTPDPSRERSSDCPASYALPASSQRYLLWSYRKRRKRNSHCDLFCQPDILRRWGIPDCSIPLASSTNNPIEVSPSVDHLLPRFSMSGLGILLPLMAANETEFDKSISSFDGMGDEHAVMGVEHMEIEHPTTDNSKSTIELPTSEHLNDERSVVAGFFDFCLSNNENSSFMIVNPAPDPLGFTLSLGQSLERARMFGRSSSLHQRQLSRRCSAVASPALQTLHHSAQLRKGKLSNFK